VQEISFCHDKKNVTVIFGENGRGKTGIYRALMFCLYGDRKLSQDGEIKSKEIHLVNTSALKNMNKPVETCVELEFQHKNEIYCMKRSIMGMMDKTEIIEEFGDIILSIRKLNGNTLTIKDPNEIELRIDSILDRRVREYFLFDGEKIETLTRASSEHRKEISKGIRNLLNIDALELAIKATKRLRKELDEELGKKSKGEFGIILNEINSNEENRLNLSNNIENIDKELKLAFEEKKSVDMEFDKIKEIRDLLRKRKEIEETLLNYDGKKSNIISEIKSKIGKISLILANSSVCNVYDYIDERKQKGEIPAEIRSELIDKILKEGICICGRSIAHKSKEYNEIILWRHKVSDAVVQDNILELWRLLSTVKNRIKDIPQETETILQRYGNIRNDIEKLRRELEKINKNIGSDRSDAASLETQREKLGKKILNLQADRQNISSELKKLEAEYEILKGKRKEKQKEEGIKNELAERAELANNSHNALCSIHEYFVSEIRKKIGKYSTEYFDLLIDEEGKETLKKVIVNDDYSIQILDRWELPFLADISAGQRQILSISFIAALAKAASNEKILEMPLFMDTPFGRLSFNHRKNLIKILPNISAQWILLATDTEFSKREANVLKKDGKWGLFYVLKQKGHGNTQIEKYDINNAKAFLHDEIMEDNI